jgi:rubrerythrin
MGTTKENLQAAFAGESQARNKYTFFAEVARQEGYHYIAKIFEETADNEMQHALDEFRALDGLGSTAENLRAAIEGEDYEVKAMYPEFAEQAMAEGDKQAAALFRMVARVEEQHRDRYKKLLKMVEDGTVYKRSTDIRWKCAACGYVHEGTEPPVKCPACKNPREMFEPESLDI